MINCLRGRKENLGKRRTRKQETMNKSINKIEMKRRRNQEEKALVAANFNHPSAV